MKRTALKIAPGPADDRDDQAAMSAALNRLYRAAASQVGDIVGCLSEGERAKLAIFCYGRTHLNAIGLAVAAHCGLEHLMAAAGSSTAGRTIYTQSREMPAPVARTLPGRRPAVTLAGSVSDVFASRAVSAPAEMSA